MILLQNQTFCKLEFSLLGFVHCYFVCFVYLPAVVMESAGFMNALTSAATAAPVVRKRKRVTTAAKVCFFLFFGVH